MVRANRAVDSTLGVTGFPGLLAPGRLEILSSPRFVVGAAHGSCSIACRKHRPTAIRIKSGDRSAKIELSKHFDCTI